MKYQGSPTFSHTQADKIGVLLTNLGTPDAPKTKELRVYLRQFLSDPRVVEVPRLLWKLLLEGIILRTRPKRSAAAYETVWTERGSPLLYITADQTAAIRQQLQQRYGSDVVVEFAMRYGNPSIASGLQSLFDQGVRKLVVLPLYPHYSAATTGSTFDAIAADFMQRRWLPEFRFINHYHDFPPFIQVLGESIKRYWQQHGQAQKLVLSYHGVPLNYLKKGDPYHCECHKTSRLVAEYLGLSKDQYITTFQSRFGREEWLKPYTDETLKQLPSLGIKSVQVVCPGFAADCLETIEEIGEENREYFIEAGGEHYGYIPALNAEAEHIAVLTQLLEQHMQGWTVTADTEQRGQLAQQLEQHYGKIT